MRTVYRYQLPFIAVPKLAMPAGAQVLDIAVQGEHVWLWALVDREETDMVNQEFLIIGTEWAMPDNQGVEFLKTLHLPSSEVYHVFRMVPEKAAFAPDERDVLHEALEKAAFDPDERDVLREALMVLYSVDTLFDNLNAKHPDLLDGEFWDVVIQVRQARQALERGVSK